MKLSTGLAVGASVAVGAFAAHATPNVSIQHAVVRVTVIPEARSDIAVTVTKVNPRLPLKITRNGENVTIDGELLLRPPNCHSLFGRRVVGVLGVGEVGDADMPAVVIRTPRVVDIGASGAVFGTVGAGDGVDLSNGGCGDWAIADQNGPLKLHVAGSGNVRAGSAAAADVAVSGSGDVTMHVLRGGLSARIAGSGDVKAATVNGPLHARVVGSGDVGVHDGAVSQMDVSVAGSGDVHFGGVAQSLTANVAGSGDVSAGRVTGLVTKHIAGSGGVHAGR
jgi:RNase P/RNase MRP subunit p29